MEDAMTLTTSERMELQRQARASTGRADSARNDPDSEVQAADVIGLSLHVTPAYSSWLNQVELWFAKIERDVIARGVYTSVPGLTRTRMRDTRHSNTKPKPVKWKYFDASRPITLESIVTVH